MGVLSCSRRGCENIMCDNYSRRFGYLCNECLSELAAKGVQTDIAEFMDSEKPGYNEAGAALIYFQSIFERRD